MPRAPAAQSQDAKIQARPPFGLDELTEGGPQIEVIDDADFRKVAEDEKFMNETMEIRFIRSGDPFAPKAIEVSVITAGRTGKMGAPTEDYPDGTPGRAARGGQKVKYTFEYGVKYPVPRFIVEAMAHAKLITLRQQRDNLDPMRVVHIEEPNFFYPFEVLSDPSGASGRAWLNKVMSDPA